MIKKLFVVVLVLSLICSCLLMSCGDKEAQATPSKPASIADRLGAIEKTVTEMSGNQADTNVKINDILEQLNRIEAKLDNR